MELPVVNHPDYVAKINDDNKFPIQKFGALAKHLLNIGVVKKFYIPKECSITTMKTSHSLEYINHIKNKTLDLKLQKKIVKVSIFSFENLFEIFVGKQILKQFFHWRLRSRLRVPVVVKKGGNLSPGGSG